MPTKSKHQKPRKIRKWMSAIEAFLAAEGVVDLDQFLGAQATRVDGFTMLPNKVRRALRDEIKAILRPHIELVNHQWVPRNSFAPFLAHTRERLGILGIPARNKTADGNGASHGVASSPLPATRHELQAADAEPVALDAIGEKGDDAVATEKSVKLTRRFAIKASEAAAILQHLVADGRIREQVTGVKSSLGPLLWAALKQGGYVVVGVGRSPALVDAGKFAKTLFVLEPREDLQAFKRANKRPQELGDGPSVAPDAWIHALRKIAESVAAGAAVKDRSAGVHPPPSIVAHEGPRYDATPATELASEPSPTPTPASVLTNGLHAALLALRNERREELASVRTERDGAVAELHRLETARVDAERKLGLLEGRERALGEEVERITDLLTTGS